MTGSKPESIAAISSLCLTFLTDAGAGYEVRIARAGDALDVPGIMSVVRETVPTAQVRRQVADELCVSLNVLNVEGFSAMFEALENEETDLGIGAIGVTVSTMEDVYIK